LQTAVYRASDIAAIAKALTVTAERVEPLLGDLEAAAWWYLVHRRPFENSDPTKLKRKLQQVSGAARRLLRHLGIDDPREAPDGPANRAVFDAVGLWTGTNDSIVAEASGRIGSLVTLLEAIDAAKLFEKLSQKATNETKELGRLMVPPGNSGDRGANDWIASMLAIYEKMTGKDPATSVGAPGRKNEGIAGGPLIRFIQAAGKPLEFELDEDAIRSRVRTILSQSARK
jgi:hypothetical protein